MPKLYFQLNHEYCHPISWHKEFMSENGLTELTVFEAKIERGSGYFWCREFYTVAEASESCGKQCPSYQPRNKKSGICTHYGYVYDQTEQSRTLKITPVQQFYLLSC